MRERGEKVRLDQFLFDHGYAESRAKAQALIRAGEVFAGERRLDKPGLLIPLATEVRLAIRSVDVSRGAAKLRGALDRFAFPIEGRLAADLGASTGGFTQVLLERGAREVHAFDVGYGLLHERLRSDSRVALHERVNVRGLSGDEMDPAEIVVMDLSFIGLSLILPAVRRISAPDADCVALVKPQFEAGKGQVGKGGIVREPRILLEVLQAHLEHLGENGFRCWGLAPSVIKGRKGNQEFFCWFRRLEHGGQLECRPSAEAVVEELLRDTRG
ncbi:MAG: TlyA family RNA methyltransferase [Candidatus Omnitrophica bacterium]|nr:16S/23S rRNA (cytidine-2'-O)-methyltransferase TlyA [bacterium]NUN94731.1 TlyA family RNA methyltransferase [Candidatus Omnitrophota bacterium]